VIDAWKLLTDELQSITVACVPRAGDLTEVISLRLTKEDRQLLERVAAKNPAATMLAVARYAMRLGLQQLEKQR
jgi:hypothetical protein